jgi:competence protein ComEC
MKLFTLGFLIGVGGIGFLMRPVSPFWALVWLILALLLYCRLPWRGLLLLIGVAGGCLWMAWQLDMQFARQLSVETLTKPALVVGRVASIPQVNWGRMSFEFKTRSVNDHKLSRLIRVGWKLEQKGQESIQLGDEWRLSVKLRQPKNKANRDGFNYGKWLFVHHITATGTVLSSKNNQLLQRSAWYHPIDQVRHYLLIHMQKSLGDAPLSDLLIALTIGDRSEMTAAQWQVLQRTGTAHLVAIAGLHIGLIAGVVFFLVSLLWCLSTRLMLWVPTTIAAGVAAWVSALIYSALAGFSLPTQRAMIMLSCFSLALIYRRVLAPWQAYFTALLLVLLLDSFSMLSISFWMSFIVVGLIIYALSHKKIKSKFYELIRMQFIVALAVIPLTLYFFHQAAWFSPVLNAVAIPWVGFIVIPISLLACFFLMFLPGVSHALWWFALKNLQLLWHFLSYVSQRRWVVWQHQVSFAQFMLLMLFTVVILGKTKKWPKMLAIFGFLGFVLFCSVQIIPAAGWVASHSHGNRVSLVLESEIKGKKIEQKNKR